jgi:hypothetical protein
MTRHGNSSLEKTGPEIARHAAAFKGPNGNMAELGRAQRLESGTLRPPFRFLSNHACNLQGQRHGNFDQKAENEKISSYGFGSPFNRQRRFTRSSATGSSPPVPTASGWDSIGTVEFSYRNSSDTQYTRFGGRMERLKFDAVDGTVVCSSVRMTFDNGRTRTIFSRTIPNGRSRTVDLPGDQRSVEKISFRCHSTGRRGAEIKISADIGSYRDEWRRSPDWQRVWSRMFTWANEPTARPNDGRDDRRDGDNRRDDGRDYNGRDNNNRDNNQRDYGRDDRRSDASTNNWVTISTASFEGRDSETAVAGWKGRSVQMIGLRPLNSDAQCTRVTATFDNGNVRTLQLGSADRMQEGRLYTADLPGDQRNLTSVDLTCHAIGQRDVRIEVLADK